MSKAKGPVSTSIPAVAKPELKPAANTQVKSEVKTELKPEAKPATKAVKPPSKPRAKAATASASPVASATDAPESLQSNQGLLDEALGETFPASDPISPATSHSDHGSASDATAGRAATSSSEPFHFPTSDDPHPGAQHVAPRVATREDRIRQAAYLRAEQRGFEPGLDVEDWLAAEAEEDSPDRAVDTHQGS